MLIGIVAALVAGLGFGVAAAVQKREAVQVTVPVERLVPTLARRPAFCESRRCGPRLDTRG